jgi:uncharacterized GH25 family protein
LGLAASADAHDTWVIPDLFSAAAGTPIAIRGRAGGDAFPSGTPVPLDRVEQVRVTNATNSVVLHDVDIADGALRLRFAPPAPGQYAVSLALMPRTTRTTVEGFVGFLEREGARPEAERVTAAGVLAGTDSVTYVHRVVAMTFVDIGGGSPRLRPGQMQLPLEFALLDDPARLHAGDSVRVQVFGDGRPLPRHGVEAQPGSVSPSSDAARSSTERAASEPSRYQRFTTDQDGVARIPLLRAGPWMLRGAYVRPAASGAARTFEVTRATVVWRVGL